MDAATSWGDYNYFLKAAHIGSMINMTRSLGVGIFEINGNFIATLMPLQCGEI